MWKRGGERKYVEGGGRKCVLKGVGGGRKCVWKGGEEVCVERGWGEVVCVDVCEKGGEEEVCVEGGGGQEVCVEWGVVVLEDVCGWGWGGGGEEIKADCVHTGLAPPLPLFPHKTSANPPLRPFLPPGAGMILKSENTD